MTVPNPADEPVDLVGADEGRGVVGRFQLNEELARGPLGITFWAFDTKTNQQITLFFPDIGIGQPWPAHLQAAFALEHPYIIGVQEFGIEANRHFVIRKNAEGTPLSQWLTGGLPRDRKAVAWTRDLALALHYAHGRGTVHGGVNAEVIIIKKRKAHLTGFAMTATPLAAACPEQARGEWGGPAGDQYSLGIVLHQLIVGRHPYGSDPKMAYSKTASPFSKPPFPRDHDPSIPFGLEAVILRAIEKEPLDRYSTCADFAVDLQKLLNGDPVSVKIRTVAQGALPRDCPFCKRRGMNESPRCLYCDVDLVGLDPRDDD